MLRLERVDVFYGAFQVLWDVDLAFGAGEVACILGPNGAGKSTVLKAVSGLVGARGRITFEGRDITRWATSRRIAAGIGHVLERRRLFAGLSVRENLALGAYQVPRGERAQSLQRVLALIPALEGMLGRRAGNLSGGQQQLVAIGRGLMGRPRLLMLDEPFLGLSPRAVDQVVEIVALLRREGLAVIFNEQNVKLSLAMSDHACLLESGRVVVHGPASEVGASDIVHQVYFGG